MSLRFSSGLLPTVSGLPLTKLRRASTARPDRPVPQRQSDILLAQAESLHSAGCVQRREGVKTKITHPTVPTRLMMQATAETAPRHWRMAAGRACSADLAVFRRQICARLGRRRRLRMVTHRTHLGREPRGGNACFAPVQRSEIRFFNLLAMERNGSRHFFFLPQPRAPTSRLRRVVFLPPSLAPSSRLHRLSHFRSPTRFRARRLLALSTERPRHVLSRVCRGGTLYGPTGVVVRSSSMPIRAYSRTRLLAKNERLRAARFLVLVLERTLFSAASRWSRRALRALVRPHDVPSFPTRR